MNTKKFIIYALLDCFMLVSTCNGYTEIVETFASANGVNRYVKGTGIKARYNVEHVFTSGMDMECEIEKENCQM